MGQWVSLTLSLWMETLSNVMNEEFRMTWHCIYLGFPHAVSKFGHRWTFCYWISSLCDMIHSICEFSFTSGTHCKLCVGDRIMRVRETRLTGIFSHILIGLSILLLPYPLSYIPRPVLDGLFLYLAVTALLHNQMFERIMLLVTEQVSGL